MSALDVSVLDDGPYEGGSSSSAIVDVTKGNFQYAVVLEPRVVGWKRDGGLPRRRMPAFTTLYKEVLTAEQEAMWSKRLATWTERMHIHVSGDA